MNFERDVLKFCDDATQVKKSEAIAIFSLWRKTFQHHNRSGFIGRFVKGTTALQRFRAKESEEFYSLFEYQHHKTPITYRCFGLHADNLPLEGRDIAIVDFEAGWSMVFYHEDGIFTNGPYYYEITEHIEAKDAP